MSAKPRNVDVVAVERVESLIHTVRGQKVMLDSDLAELYCVTTSRLNEQVKRNAKRFPADFAFQMTRQEFRTLMSQIAISKSRGGRRKLPWVFTEHGAIMAATVLNSARAVEASLFVVRAFVRMRVVLNTHKEFASRLTELERMVQGHDVAIRAVVEAIKQLAALPEPFPEEAAPPKEGIGFLPKRT